MWSGAKPSSEQSSLCTFFSLLPPGLAALLRSACFFSGAVFFARLTLARSAFHGFQIGFQLYEANLYRIQIVRSKSIYDSSGTQRIYIGFQYATNLLFIGIQQYATDVYKLSVVRTTTQQIYIGFQWYAANL